jgi:CDP-glucose 4,6-dehydratase
LISASPVAVARCPAVQDSLSVTTEPPAADVEPWAPSTEFWRHRPVAVTGATGFVGSHLTAALVELGAVPVVLCRDAVPSNAISRQWVQHVSWVTGQLEDQAILERLLGDYEVTTVFHLAAQSQVGVANSNPAATFEANVRGSWNLLEAVRRSPRVGQVILASSDKAYGSQPHLPYTEDMPLLALHPYDVSKACADMIAMTYAKCFGTPVTITRCGNFFGPGDTNWARLVPGTIRDLLRGERPVIRSDGRMVRDYLYVQDGVRAYLQLAEAQAAQPALAGSAFNFSLEQPLTVLGLVELIQRATGTAIEVDVRATASHEIPAQALSAERARKVLGWSPALTMQEALNETVEWYRAHATTVEAG